jgi:hypothetical protein
MTTVEAACKALVEDADRWREAADVTAGASQLAGSLTPGKDQFGRIAEDRGVVTAYSELRQKLNNMLAGAPAEFGKIATALTESAQTYLLEDEKGEHAIRKIEDRPR